MNTPAMTIRRGAPDDTPALVEFNLAMACETEKRILSSATVERGVRALFDGRGEGFYLVAEVEPSTERRQVVGALMVTYEWSDWRDRRFWWLQSVYVRPEFRRRGVFRTLFQFLQQEAKSRPDVCGLRLYVERENNIAQKTYQTMVMAETPYQMYEMDFD